MSVSSDALIAPVVLVLASGRGERFVASGGRGSKLQALLAGRAVLDRTLESVRASGLAWHLEDGGHPGMGDAIAAAVRATPQAAGWLILPGDLPLIQPDTLRAVAQALTRAPAGVTAVIPVHAGQRGHPVGFSAAAGGALAALTGPQGAARVLRELSALELVVSDIGCVTDIDTLADLALAEQRFAARGG